MSEMLWWAIFVLPTLTAVAWALWPARAARPGNTFRSVAAHRRFVQALSQNESAPRPAPGGSADGAPGSPDPAKPAPGYGPARRRPGGATG